jgi:hypothetical protein
MTGEPSDVVMLTSVANEAEAAIILAALEDGGVFATMTGELTSGLRACAPGEVHVLVRRADLSAAEGILDQHETFEAD